jgi:hypothetical protein
MLIPILPQQLHRMLGAAGAVAALQVVRGAILVAAPADALGVLGMEGKFLGQGDSPETTGPARS